MKSTIILITGASSGIGLAAAVYLAKRGHKVIASARNMADVERLRHIGLDAVLLDVADSRSIRQGLSDAIALHGKLDVLINNAGYGQPGAVEDLTREALREQFETNFFGLVEMMNHVLPYFRAQGHGRIINNSSVLGLVAMPFRGAYNSSKFAIEAISDTLRLELGGTDIYVSLVEPGPILSRFRENAHAAFKRHINAEQSVHADAYARMEARLMKTGAAQPFTLPAEAVAKKMALAIESRRPKPRYFVTFPTYLFAVLRRLLPSRLLDLAVRKIH